MSRKLDMAIAEALGYEVEDRTNQPTYVDFWTQKGDLPWHKVPEYSSDGNAMLELDAEMRKRSWSIDVGCYTGGWLVVYWYKDNPKAKAGADTEPLARALAAYYALTGRDWSE